MSAAVPLPAEPGRPATLVETVAVPEPAATPAPGLSWDRFLKLPGDGPAVDKMLDARDRFVDSLVQSGNPPEYARAVADRTATTHDRRGK